jgi:hypothetical protein
MFTWAVTLHTLCLDALRVAADIARTFPFPFALVTFTVPYFAVAFTVFVSLAITVTVPVTAIIGLTV